VDLALAALGGLGGRFGIGRDALLDQLVPVLFVEDAARIAGVQLAEVGVSTSAAAAAVVLEFAHLAVVQPSVAVAEQLPELVVAEDVNEAPLADVALLAMRQIDARRDRAVGLDGDIIPAGAAAAEILGDDAGLLASAAAGMAARLLAFRRCVRN